MSRLNRTVFIVFSLILLSWPAGKCFCNSMAEGTGNIQDTLTSSQILYNGRAWRNVYTAIKGDPYLWSKEFLTGSVTISGKTFDNNRLLYDICKDEVMILSDKKFILQLNKELVDRFTLIWNNQVIRFVRLEGDSTSAVSGYVNELYGGHSAVYVKYRKTIEMGVVDDKYDGFIQTSRVFVVKDGVPRQVKNKKQLIELFKDNKQKITGYIKSNKLDISGKRPESFVPVAAYYDSLNR